MTKESSFNIKRFERFEKVVNELTSGFTPIVDENGKITGFATSPAAIAKIRARMLAASGGAPIETAEDLKKVFCKIVKEEDAALEDSRRK